MWTSVPKNQRVNLAYRTLQGVATTFFLYDAVRYLPLVEVALITNLMPLFTALFGYWLLKEVLTIADVIMLFASFSGIVVLILGGQSAKESAHLPSEVLLATILLISVPILNASGNIALR